MAEVRPFRGYRYNPDKVSDLAKLMAPPYYAISDEGREKLYERDKYNAVRVVLGRRSSDDTPENNCYTRAAQTFNNWIEQGVLKRDEKNTIYLYEQSVVRHEASFSNKGFIVQLKLEDSSAGNVVPCEETVPSYKKDRYGLLSETHMNVSMIDCMYTDPDNEMLGLMTEISDSQPDMEFESMDGVTQRVWMITGEENIKFIIEYFKHKKLFITEGQNRYETALHYRDEQRAANPSGNDDESYNYIMALLTNAGNDGLVQMPVHRLVSKDAGVQESRFIALAQDHFRVEKIIVDANLEEFVSTIQHQIATPRKENKIAVYFGGNYFYRLILTDTEYMQEILPDKSEAYRSLDVTVLNHVLLGDILHISPEDFQTCVTFTKHILQGVKKVQENEYDCIFIINSAKISQIMGVAEAGEKMPRRTVNIFPRPATGIVFNKLVD